MKYLKQVRSVCVGHELQLRLQENAVRRGDEGTEGKKRVPRWIRYLNIPFGHLIERVARVRLQEEGVIALE